MFWGIRWHASCQPQLYQDYITSDTVVTLTQPNMPPVLPCYLILVSAGAVTAVTAALFVQMPCHSVAIYIP